MDPFTRSHRHICPLCAGRDHRGLPPRAALILPEVRIRGRHDRSRAPGEMLAELDRSIGVLRGDPAVRTGRRPTRARPDRHRTRRGHAGRGTPQRRRCSPRSSALERHYGQCADCGRPVTEGRLEARPEASRCMQCQAQARAPSLALLTSAGAGDQVDAHRVVVVRCASARCGPARRSSWCRRRARDRPSRGTAPYGAASTRPPARRR